ncbi:lytic murein transglycosylase [Williamsia sp. MIQD14]|uniref:lytic murein transglycosylase n=1 Tax=Williamsia sp. MIQD14 TaxID=3425703 RepID=UPI003DA0BF5E
MNAGRYVPMGVATLLVGVFVLGAATSSAQRQPASALAAAEVTPAAAIVDTGPRALGFAPPAAPAAAAGAGIVTAGVRTLAPALPSGPLGIPGIMLRAYKLAADRVGAENSACKLPWFLLAGIGRIESGHAGDGSVDASGTTINPIAGPVLDGSLAGNAVITDTDRGSIDGDPVHDRAMGPMQFIPSTWAAWGSDGNGDGRADPNNIFDATYSAGRYLCAGVSDIMAPQHRVAAVLRYNNSLDYVSNVLTWALAYATGAVPTASVLEVKRPATSAAPTPGAPRAPGAVPPSGVPGAPTASGTPGAPGSTPAPSARLRATKAAFVVPATIAVTSPAGPVSCTVDLTVTVAPDGTSATVGKAVLSGANPLCGIARTAALPWTITPTGPTSIEVAGVGVDALGTRCGPIGLAGELTGALTAAAPPAGPCVIRSLTLRPTPSLALEP